MKKKISAPEISVGIDYSMLGPAMCVHTGPFWSWRNCQFFFLTDRKKGQILDKYFYGSPIPIHSTPEERFDKISDFFLSYIPPCIPVFLENYSFNSRGKVFHIGENCGILKNKLYKQQNKIYLISPGGVKKMATGRGLKVSKQEMTDAFIKETGFPIDSHFGVKSGTSPISDIVDSYYVCKAGFEYSTNPKFKIKIS